MYHPKISIITVVYNGDTTIERTIQSVLRQNYDNVEYIIIDGASTDGTVDIIKRYEKNISKWISEKDNGIYDAMNKGIRYSTGDIIAFLNSDDWYLDGALSNVVMQFTKKDSDIYFWGVTRDDNGKRFDRYPELRRLENQYERLAVFHPATFAKKSIFSEIGDFDTAYRIAADYDWLIRAKNYGCIMQYVDCVTTYYSDGGISTKDWYEAQREAEKIDLKCAQNEFERKTIDLFYKNNRCNRKYIDMLKQPEPCLICADDMKLCLKKDVYVFGAGNMGKECHQLLWQNGIKIKGFIDNNQDKWGKRFREHLILSPEVLDLEKDVIVISSVQYEENIKSQLIQMGMDVEKIISYSFLKNMVMTKIKEEGI